MLAMLQFDILEGRIEEQLLGQPADVLTDNLSCMTFRVLPVELIAVALAPR